MTRNAIQESRRAPNNVRRMREELLLTKAELARKAGVSPLTVARVAVVELGDARGASDGDCLPDELAIQRKALECLPDLAKREPADRRQRRVWSEHDELLPGCHRRVGAVRH